MAMGEQFACAVTSTNALYCWGRNATAELGLGHRLSNMRGAQLVQGSYTTVATGERHACAIDLQKRIACWGLGTFGQLGDGQFTSRQVPTLVPSSESWIAVDARNNYTCAIAEGGKLYCWGLGDFGQLGLPNAWRTTFGLIAPAGS